MSVKRRARRVIGSNTTMRIERSSAGRARRGMVLANPFGRRTVNEFEVKKGSTTMGRVVRTVNFKSKYRVKASSGHSGG